MRHLISTILVDTRDPARPTQQTRLPATRFRRTRISASNPNLDPHQHKTMVDNLV